MSSLDKNKDKQAVVEQEVEQEVVPVLTEQEKADKAHEDLLSLQVLKPANVQTIWDSSDANKLVQDLILDYLPERAELIKLSQGSSGHMTNLQNWDEYENRYEPNELKWIADYIIHGLVFAKKDLQLETDEQIAHVVHALWNALDLFSEIDHEQIAASKENSYRKLQQWLSKLFHEKQLTKSHVAKILAYGRVSLFGHLHLYRACIGMKKQKRKEIRVELVCEKPKFALAQSLDAEGCREIVEERALTAEEKAGSALVGDQAESEGEPEEFVDPNDPLYGLEQRLAGLEIDEESKRIIKTKLLEASGKIKTGLETRQQNLDAKLAAQPAGKKK